MSGTGGEAPPRGVLHALRGIGPQLLSLARTRLELFGVELAEERARTIEIVVGAALALLCAALALLMLNVLVLAWFWHTHRFAAIVALLLLYGGAAMLLFLRVRAVLASRPPMFEATVAEIKADIEALQRAGAD
ncbi:MAG: phage holin family protein [Burkholderiales bacterium]|nr:phage holin family protein [Burkholderiales bacterium]